MINYSIKFNTKERTVTLHNETLLLLISMMEEEGWVEAGALVPGRLSKADKESIRNYQLIALTRLRNGSSKQNNPVQLPPQYAVTASYSDQSVDYTPSVLFGDDDFEP